MRSARPKGKPTVRPAPGLVAIALCAVAATAQASAVAPTSSGHPVQAAVALRGDRQPKVVVAPTPSAPPVVGAAAPVRPAALTTAAVEFGDTGIPGNVLAAYRATEKRFAEHDPGCHLRWYHLAGIGKVESGHARGGRTDVTGTTSAAILGPVLDGSQYAAIGDTDGGTYDGDAVWDRAVGPMQFIPSTWRHYAADGNRDGEASPHNIYDAAEAAGRYLCSGGLDLSRTSDLDAAVFRYNHSAFYVLSVESWMRAYAGDTKEMPPPRPSTAVQAVHQLPQEQQEPVPPVPLPHPVPAEDPPEQTKPVPPVPLPHPVPVEEPANEEPAAEVPTVIEPHEITPNVMQLVCKLGADQAARLTQLMGLLHDADAAGQFAAEPCAPEGHETLAPSAEEKAQVAEKLTAMKTSLLSSVLGGPRS